MINKTSFEIKKGQLIYIEKKELYVYLFGRYRKYKWYFKLFFKPTEVGVVSNINTDGLKKGSALYLSPENPGGFVSKIKK